MKWSEFLIAAGVFFIGALFPVSADPLKIMPYLSLEQEYSDNIIFTADNTEADAITTVSGGVTIQQKTELLDAVITGQLDQILYWDFDELNSLDSSASGRINYRVTERFGVGASAQYKKDSRRDRETDTTGLLVSGDRETAQFSLSSNYLVSETTKVNLEAGYGVSEIDETNRDEDDDDFQVDLSFSKNLSATFKNTVGLLNLSYLRYTSDIETVSKGEILTTTGFQEYTSDVFQFSTGLSKDITELYNIYCLVGASYSQTKENSRIRQTLTGTNIVVGDVKSPEQDDDTWGGVISTGLNYDGLYYDLGLSLSQDVRGASGTNGTVQRTALVGNIDRKVTDTFTLTLDASCYLNENDRKSQADTDELTINIQPGFRYRFDHDFILSGFYRFTSVEDRQENETRERNMIYVVLKKEFEL